MNIDGYVLYEPVGFGAKGPLWRCVDAQGRVSALQVLGTSLSADLEKRVEVLRKLDSPYVVEVQQIRKATDGRFVILYEFLEGQNLEILRAGQRLGSAQLNFIGLALARGLADLHAAGLTHGDISPANAVLTTHGRVVWVDVLGSPEGTTLAFNEPLSQPTPADDVYAFAQMMSGLGMEPRLLGEALNPDSTKRTTAMALAKSWESLPRAGVGMLSGSELMAAKMRAAGRDVTTTLVGKRRQRLNYESANAAREEREQARASRPQREGTQVRPSRSRAYQSAKQPRILKIAIPSLAGAAFALALVLVVPRFLPPAVATGEPAREATSAPQLPAPGEILETPLSPESEDVSGESPSPREVAPSPGASAKLEGTPSQSDTPVPDSLLPSADFEKSGAENLLETGSITNENEALAVMQEILNRRDRAIVENDAKALGALTVKDSIISQADSELLAQLRRSGTSISGLATAVKDVVIVEGKNDRIRLRVTLLQGAYTQTDRLGNQHQIPPLAEVHQEITLLSHPWRIASVVRLD